MGEGCGYVPRPNLCGGIVNLPAFLRVERLSATLKFGQLGLDGHLLVGELLLALSGFVLGVDPPCTFSRKPLLLVRLLLPQGER